MEALPSLADLGLVVAMTAGVALVVAGIALLALRRRQGRSLTSQLVVIVLALVGSMVISTVVVARLMFLSAHDLVVTLWVTGVAGLVSLLGATLLGRRVMRTIHHLLDSARAVAAGRTVRVASSGTTELDALATELATTSETLARARQDLERADTSRRELVAWVSHDLRTPLASIRAMAEALEDGLVDDPARYHRGIRTQVDHLSSLVDDLFELSRLQSGQLPQQLTPTSVYDLVSDVVADLSPLARERGVSITPRGDLHATILADEGQLVRALENLVSNALRFSPAGSTVEIGVAQRPELVEITVSDQGGGIPPEQVSRVFEAGWRGDEARGTGSTGSAPAGAGLGLAIVKSIVEAHQGTVGVGNDAGGSRFTITLPTGPARDRPTT